jgi:hypothetical protein
MAIKLNVVTKKDLDVNKLLDHVEDIRKFKLKGDELTLTDPKHNVKFVTDLDSKHLDIDVYKGSHHQLEIRLPDKELLPDLKNFSFNFNKFEKYIEKQKLKLYGNKGDDKFESLDLKDVLKGGRGDDDLGGAGGKDKIYGGKGDDDISGGGKKDKCYGGKGNDDIHGGGGSDVIAGQKGTDSLYGGSGGDRFDFDRLKDSKVGLKHDTINDFSHLDGDHIDLRTLDADMTDDGNQAFHYIGDAGFTGDAGELRFSGGLVQGDVSGDGLPDFEIHVIGALLVESDFYL